MTGYTPSKLDRQLTRLRTTAKVLERMAPIAAKRANSGDTTPDGLVSGGGGRGSAPADPTAAAALASPPRDEVDALWRAASGDLSSAVVALDRAAAAVSRLLDVGESKRGRERLPACLVCTGPAFPSRRGMCDACRQRWRRAGQPELVAWRDRDADGVERARLKWRGMPPL